MPTSWKQPVTCLLYTSKVSKVDTEFSISWTEGAMEFDAMPFPLLIARLSRCYNVDIQIASKELETMKFTGVDVYKRQAMNGLKIRPTNR